MTREELFERYLADTLDDDASAELEALLADDPEFAAKFAQDLIETGHFKEVGGELQRVNSKDRAKVAGDKSGKKDKDKDTDTDTDKDKDTDKDGKGKAKGKDAVPGKPKPLKLITGGTEDLPPSLQRLLPGAQAEPPPPEPPAVAPPLSVQPPPAEAHYVAPPVVEPPVAETPVEESPLAEVRLEEAPVAQPPIAEPPIAQPPIAEPPIAQAPIAEAPIAEPPIAEPPIAEPPIAEPPIAEPPIAEPPIAEPPIAEPPIAEPPIAEPPIAQPPIAAPPVVEQPVHPLASTLPPPAPPPPVARYPAHAPIGAPHQFFGHHEQPQLLSSRQRSPGAWIAIAAVLFIGIGVALFLGLTKKPPPPPVNAGVIAKVDSVEGTVTLTRALKTEQVAPNMNLFEGDIINVQQGSARIAYVSEKTYLHIRSASEITLEDHKIGKNVRLTLGELTVEAAPQPAGRPMVVLTDNAKTILMGTRVTVRAISKETLVEVSQGSVFVESRKSGVNVEVGRGAWAIVSEEQPLQPWGFVAAVNLNGAETNIDGNPWWSYEGARAKGLVVAGIEKPVEAHTSTQQPRGYVPHAELRSVLASSVVSRGGKLSFKWPQPNGSYQVFVWLMEDAGDRVRALRLNVEEKLVSDELGKDQLNGQWNRYGPFRAEVKDGALDLLVSADHKLANRDPHLAGIAIYSVGGSKPAAPSNPGAPETPGAPLPPGEPGSPPGIQPTVP